MSVDPKEKLLLITGPAGAGRSTAIKILEDLGYEAIDNMPMYLVRRLLSGTPLDRPLAIGVDARTRGFEAGALLELVEDQGATLVFLDCDEETLLRRFSETRRRHPLAAKDTPLIGIQREIELMRGLRERADILIDTSELSPHELKAEISGMFDWEKSNTLAVSVQSFSYKRGTPRGIDMILDCRFLRNPHWEKDLRALNGTNDAVAAFVMADPLYEPFFKQLCDMCELLLPAYRKEGKAYFSIGLGCSGGKHRSVTVAENLMKVLAQSGWQVSIRHRELDRQADALATLKGTVPK